MFRQIKVHPDDVMWQKILWRADPESPLLTYYLLTVPNETNCAPNFALKVLKQLAKDIGTELPLRAEILEKPNLRRRFLRRC